MDQERTEFSVGTGDSTAHTARTAQDGLGGARSADSGRAVDGQLGDSVGGLPPKGETNRPGENGTGAIDNADSGRLGGSGGRVPPRNGDGQGEPASEAPENPPPAPRTPPGQRQPDRDANGETAMGRAQRWQQERKASESS